MNPINGAIKVDEKNDNIVGFENRERLQWNTRSGFNMSGVFKCRRN